MYEAVSSISCECRSGINIMGNKIEVAGRCEQEQGRQSAAHPRPGIMDAHRVAQIV